jgi:outer membrane protein OmpA-like peptidoglycan-associated protein
MSCGILSLIADDKRAQDLGLNLTPPNAYYQFMTPIARQVVDLPSVEEIGRQRLLDIKDFNLFKPVDDIYERLEINPVPVGVIDSPEIYDYIEPYFYDNITPLNEYRPEQPNELYNVPDAVNYDTYYINYPSYIDSIRENLDRRFRNIITIITNTVPFEDTDLGTIADTKIRDGLLVNFSENVFQRTVGRLNTDLFSILDGDPLIRRDFVITIPRTPLGRTLDIVAKLQGINTPYSYIPPEAFDLYTKTANNSTDERNTLLLQYTGRALGKNLITQFQRENHFYYPYIETSDGEILNSNVYSVVDQNLSFSDYDRSFGDFNDFTYDIVSREVNQKNPELLHTYSDLRGNDDIAEWGDQQNLFKNKKSLLYKTKEIVLNNSDKAFINSFSNEFGVIKNGKRYTIPRGDGITAKGDFIADDGLRVKSGDFYRTFTKGRKYDRLSRTLRHKGLDNGDTRSVLGENGIVHIAPTYRVNSNGEITDYRKYMFSITNYAWKDNVADIPECERYVDADGTIGRTMWFAPYNLTMNESVTINTNDSTFFGRPESIVTQNNVSRTLSLSFALITDYPDIMNNFEIEESHMWERYFKGDLSVKNEIDTIIREQLNVRQQEVVQNAIANTPPVEAAVDSAVPSQQIITDENNSKENNNIISLYSVFFPNEETEIPIGSSLNNGYEYNKTLGYTYLKGVQKVNRLQYRDQTNFSLNQLFVDRSKNIMIEKFTEYFSQTTLKEIKIIFSGYASKPRTSRISNEKLSLLRAENIQTYFKNEFNKAGLSENIPPWIKITYEVRANSDTFAFNTGEDSAGDSWENKYERRVDITVQPIYAEQEVQPPTQTVEDIAASDNLADQGEVNRDVNEFLGTIPDDLRKKIYFTRCKKYKFLEINSKMSFDKIAEYIPYFHPAFNSYTPQNFNERLTFLHQCTRTANNINLNQNDPTNIFYGYQPYVYLSIGDFIKTKALITNLTIDYNTPDMTWDLNPEGGAGVQPMFATVTLSLTLFGGQSMSGALSRLQNALSFNYYANTEMYDIRSDSLKIADINNLEKDAEIIDGIRYSNVNKKNEEQQKVENIKLRQQQGIFLPQQVGTVNRQEKYTQNNVGDLISLKRLLNLE